MRFFYLISALIVASFPGGGVLSAASAKPNVVVIFIDDMGYGDIGPFGSKLNRTPNLDRMAAEGMKLTSFYAAPVCSVSRAQLLTGCYGPRISVPGVYFPGHANGLNPEETTIAEVVKPQGYATMCIGKWHVGDQPQFLPTNQGFDHYFGIPYSNDMQRTSLESGEKVVPLLRDDKVAELLTDEAQTHVTERYTEEAVKFIRDHQGGPFLLYFPHTAVHTPIVPGPNFAGKSANGRFGDWVEEVDWSVGRVLDTLRELKLDQNTLVVFTSDNGPWLIKESDGGTALPLRGGKGSTWEGGVREPTLAWWPGTIQAGSVCDTVAGTIDLLPTIAALSGGIVPSDRVIDGRNIAPLLKGETTEAARDAHFYFASYNLQAVRRGPWKLAVMRQKETMGRDEISADVGAEPRLYNLDVEVSEKTNVADEHPEVVAELQRLIEAQRAEIAAGQRPAGAVENPVTLYPAEARAKKPKASPQKPAKPVALGTLQIGDSLSPEAAPQVGGRPFILRCQVDSKGADGVLVSHGGSATGYTLYLKAGSAVFAVRHGKSITRVTSKNLPGGGMKLAASLAKDGTLSLSVNDGEIVTAKAPGLLPKQPVEDFDLGFDAKNTVDTYDGKTLFPGSITGLVIE